MVTLSDIEQASARLQNIVHRTPVLTSQALNAWTGAELFLKCENFQKVGAFKYRGASNAITQLDDKALAKGVCTHSSGNHAQALALAARGRGVPAYIVMPTSAPKVKRDAVIGYGATVIDCAPTLEARETTADEVVARYGATFIHPYDHPDIIAGQGTAAYELLQDYPNLDAIIAPVGGGGLMSGTAIAAKGINPAIRVFGAEPKGADDAYRSFKAGKLLLQEGPDTFCDGLLTSLGELTWPIIRDNLEAVLLADDNEILEALRLIWSRMKIIIEPSCATPVAALRKHLGASKLEGKKIGVILSGGNVDLDALPW
ncbi:MAG: pyridoxal-phosphate dependent enzyme [Myxococcota bacterium]|nr:pyridoxal-phosphate dependent enzyme [Myxococcota bacterium]